MAAKTLMIQGTASHVGKSILVTALCRVFRRQGVRVAPFKAQNMSNNSFVTSDGREIGRAQAVQAAACGLEPRADFNPILIKPADSRRAQLIVNGRVAGTLTARRFGDIRRKHARTVAEAFRRVASEFELVILEGAGSPAEINLREHDVVNMHMARLARAPVLLVGDIDRGGVFAALVGTLALLAPEEQAHIKGFVINKFRGDRALLAPGLELLEARTGIACLGVLPYWGEMPVPQEDSLGWQDQHVRLGSRSDTVTIGIADLPAISNPTDFEALGNEPDVRMLRLTRDTHERLEALIFPGTKSTSAALAFVRERGLDRLARRVWEEKGVVVGICGGYQILGVEIRDPYGIESDELKLEGLGLLGVTTTFRRRKILSRVSGRHLETGCVAHGYRVHMGRTRRGSGVQPLFHLAASGSTKLVSEGAVSPDGRVWGTYLHGVFDASAYRRMFLNGLRRQRGWDPLPEHPSPSLEEGIDGVADHVERHLDLDRIARMIAEGVRA
jgi:adenosylcobyric acid synthase